MHLPSPQISDILYQFSLMGLHLKCNAYLQGFTTYAQNKSIYNYI